MARPTEVVYTNEELVRLLIKDQGITTGNWMLLVRFRQLGANVPDPDNPSTFMPAGITLIREIGLTEADRPVPGLTVNAKTGESFAEEVSGPTREAPPRTKRRTQSLTAGKGRKARR